MRSRAGLLVFAVVGLACFSAAGQAKGQAGDGNQTYTLGTSARLVIEDVLVTDAQGNLVKGLPESAFHVTDDGAAQKIVDFDESARGEQVQKQVARPGVFSNAAMLNPGGQIVVLLIDTVGMDLPDQMYLRLQMLKYLASMPAGIEVAVFKTYGSAAPLLVQSLTMDHGLVVKAIDNSVPSIPRTSMTGFANAISEVANISQYLSQLPGRKQLIWFSGKFPLFVSPLNGGVRAAKYDQAEQHLRIAYRLLERARVEVFPVDVRGVTQGGPGLNQAGNVQAMQNDPSVHGASSVGEGANDASGYDAMQTMAASTGGRAFYSTNGLTQAFSSAVEMGSRSYTLSYRPEPYTQDGSWHTVKLAVDGPYKVSYRQGYYAEDATGTTAKQLASSAKAAGLGDAVNAPMQPAIAFQVQLERGNVAGAHGVDRYTVRYGIQSSDLEFVAGGEGKQEAQVKVAALAYDGDGDVASSSVEDLTTHFDARQMGIAARVGVPMIQQIEVRKGAKYLLLAVFDMRSGRSGTVQLTTDSAKEASR